MANAASSNYMLDLPEDLLFPNRESLDPFNFGAPADAKWVVQSIEDHHWAGNVVEFEVLWQLGDSTWKTFDDVKKLKALDNYLKLKNVVDWKELPGQTGRIVPHGRPHRKKDNSPPPQISRPQVVRRIAMALQETENCTMNMFEAMVTARNHIPILKTVVLTLTIAQMANTLTLKTVGLTPENSTTPGIIDVAHDQDQDLLNNLTETLR
ncbi:hypothetical protein C8J56DRAFT_1063522 [Mycena floridula]|nr:hypothetical protein C8J56DRAFT_1063522 [Mycena floridula]